MPTGTNSHVHGEEHHQSNHRSTAFVQHDDADIKGKTVHDQLQWPSRCSPLQLLFFCPSGHNNKITSVFQLSVPCTVMAGCSVAAGGALER